MVSSADAARIFSVVEDCKACVLQTIVGDSLIYLGSVALLQMGCPGQLPQFIWNKCSFQILSHILFVENANFMPFSTSQRLIQYREQVIRQTIFSCRLALLFVDIRSQFVSCSLQLLLWTSLLPKTGISLFKLFLKPAVKAENETHPYLSKYFQGLHYTLVKDNNHTYVRLINEILRLVKIMK